MAAVSVSGIPLGWGGSFFLGESQSRIYPNMCAKFGCGPTVVSRRRWGGGGGYRQTGEGTLQLYIVDERLYGAFECGRIYTDLYITGLETQI